jgi:hypothetical protein
LIEKCRPNAHLRLARVVCLPVTER